MVACPRKTNSINATLPAVMPIDTSASTPHQNARPSEINWFPRYERFSGKPQIRLSATSKGIKIPVEVTNSITSETICAWCRAPTMAFKLRITKSCPAGR